MSRLFITSRNPSTHLWLIELIFLLSQKYNPKEILAEAKIKKELHAQITTLLMNLANNCAKLNSIVFNDPKAEGTKFKMVLPFPPTVYEIYKNYVKNKEATTTQIKLVDGSQQDLEVLLDNIKIERLMFDKFESDTTETGLYDRYRLFCFKTLKRIGLLLVQNTYSPERIDRIIKKVTYLFN